MHAKRSVEILKNLQFYFYFHFYKIVDLPAINAVQQMGCLLQFSSETHLVISLFAYLRRLTLLHFLTLSKASPNKGQNKGNRTIV